MRNSEIVLIDKVPFIQNISGVGTAALLVVLVLVALYLRPKNNNVAEPSATSSVATQVVATSGITIVRDRGARLNFVPAKAGTNNEIVAGGPVSK